MSEGRMITAADRFRVAHASRVSGFGVAPKRTFPLAPSHLCTFFVFKSVVRKVREPETDSPTRETRALPNQLNSRMGVDVALVCNPERDEGSRTGCGTHPAFFYVINGLMGDPSPSALLGMTAY